MSQDHCCPNVVARRGEKKVRYRVSDKKEQITILDCVNALGQTVPPMVIFEGKYLNYQWTDGEVPGTYDGMSGKGWMDQELFRHWLKDHFLRYAVPSRPLLLLLDGHSSHYDPVSVELAKEEDVIVFCLPPHTTQDSQPLDCTVFGPLKRHWSDVCHNFQQRNPGVVVSKLNLSSLLLQAWLKALTPEISWQDIGSVGSTPSTAMRFPSLQPSNKLVMMPNHPPQRVTLLSGTPHPPWRVMLLSITPHPPRSVTLPNRTPHPPQCIMKDNLQRHPPLHLIRLQSSRRDWRSVTSMNQTIFYGLNTTTLKHYLLTGTF